MLRRLQITQSNDPAKPFQVEGETFVGSSPPDSDMRVMKGGCWSRADQTKNQNDFQSAVNRACDNQHNECADVANGKKGTLTVGDCDKQNGTLRSSGLVRRAGEARWGAERRKADCVSRAMQERGQVGHSHRLGLQRPRQLQCRLRFLLRLVTRRGSPRRRGTRIWVWDEGAYRLC